MSCALNKRLSYLLFKTQDQLYFKELISVSTLLSLHQDKYALVDRESFKVTLKPHTILLPSSVPTPKLFGFRGVFLHPWKSERNGSQTSFCFYS